MDLLSRKRLPEYEHPMSMTKWISVGPVGDFPQGEHVCTQADGRPVVIFHTADGYYATSNICPHAGLPLGEGDCHGKIITCPFHGYAYNIETGRNVDWPHDEPPVKTYPVRVEAGEVQVEVVEHIECEISDGENV